MNSNRRNVLEGFVGVALLAGCSELESGDASLEWANERDEEVWIDAKVEDEGGLLSAPSVVYDDRKRLFPTGHYRAVDCDPFAVGDYRVEVTVESEDRQESTGPHVHQWTRRGCENQTLIISVETDLNVEFTQWECD